MSMDRRGLGRLDLALWAAVLLVAAIACGSGSKTNFPALSPFASDLQQRLHAIRDKASEVRGLPVNNRAVEGEVSRATLRGYAQQQLAKTTTSERKKLDAFNGAFRLMHLIGPQDDLLKLFAGQFSEDTLGLYFFNEHKLALVAENSATIAPKDELTLAHEYVHSFQDSAFDTARLQKLADNEKDGSRSEYSSTVSCLEEGDATLAEALYGERVYGPNWYAQTLGAGQPQAEAAVPPAIQRYFAFDYNECAAFVAALYHDGGWNEVNQAYKDPPWTTEQILHPEKYRVRESVGNKAPASLEKQLGAGWGRLDLSLFGEFDIYNYLATILGNEPLAAGAAAGWGSGWISVYAKRDAKATAPPGVLVHLQLDWDTTADFDKFLATYAVAVQKLTNGQFQNEGANGPVHWDKEGEYGYVAWNRQLTRVDIVITSNRDARDAARKAL